MKVGNLMDLNLEGMYATKNDAVYLLIKEEIVNGSFHPGERLTVAQLAKKYNVSPMPVREALKRLQQDGLIENVPHVGARVMQFDFDKFKEIVYIRNILEPLAVKLAASFLTDEQIEELEELINKMRSCVENKDIKSYTRLNNQFHDYLYKNCGNSTLYEIITSLREKSEHSRSIFSRDVSRIDKSFEEHEKCFKYLKLKDSKKAYESFKEHKEEGFKIIIKKLEEEMN